MSNRPLRPSLLARDVYRYLIAINRTLAHLKFMEDGTEFTHKTKIAETLLRALCEDEPDVLRYKAAGVRTLIAAATNPGAFERSELHAAAEIAGLDKLLYVPQGRKPNEPTPPPD